MNLENEYKCNICNKLYKSYQSLWNHNNKFHDTTSANILKKSKVKVVKSTVILDSKTAVWKLKVKK